MIISSCVSGYNNRAIDDHSLHRMFQRVQSVSVTNLCSKKEQDRSQKEQDLKKSKTFLRCTAYAVVL